MREGVCWQLPGGVREAGWPEGLRGFPLYLPFLHAWGWGQEAAAPVVVAEQQFFFRRLQPARVEGCLKKPCVYLVFPALWLSYSCGLSV